jgi:hypothetical protein
MFFRSHDSLHCLNLWSLPLSATSHAIKKTKRRRSLHLPAWGSRLPLSDKRKRPTPQTGDNTVKKQFAETRKNKPQKAV